MSLRSIGIIGYGDFGKFLHHLARIHLPDTEVKVFSRREASDHATFFPLEEVCACEVLILSVSISAFEEVVSRVVPLLGEETIVVDVATVKEYTVDILKRAGVPRFVAMHPMFGPYSYEKHAHSLDGLRLALCESTLSKSAVQALTSALQNVGLTVLLLSPEEHDRLVAETLFLTHLVGQTVKKAGFVRTSIDTVSFGFLMDAVESVAHDEALFRDVYRYNRYCTAVLERFRKSEEAVTNSLLSEE